MNQLFKKHDDKSAQDKGQVRPAGSWGWVRWVLLPSWTGGRKKRMLQLQPILSCACLEGLVFFLRRKIIENYWILCLEQGNNIFPLRAVQLWHPRNHIDTNQGTLQPSVWKNNCRLNVKLEKMIRVSFQFKKLVDTKVTLGLDFMKSLTLWMRKGFGLAGHSKS